jgi:hypothetical protein
MRCPNCINEGKIQLCRFIGHEGIFKDKRVFEHRAIEHWKCRRPALGLLPVYIAGLFDEDRYTVEPMDNDLLPQYLSDMSDYHIFSSYYVGDKNLYYADPKGIYITGPDGGFSHNWKCPSCLRGYSISDK